MRLSILTSKELTNAGWLIGGKVVQMLLALVIGVLTTRYLGPGDYGLVAYGTAYVNFFMVLCTLGIDSVIIKDFIDHPNEHGRTIGTAIGLRLGSSFCASAVIIGIVSVMDRGRPITIAVAALCSAALLFHAFDTINFWFQAQYQSKVTAIATFAAYLATSAYKIVLLISGKDVRWFAFATSVDSMVLGCVLLLAYRKHHGPKPEFSLAKGKQLLGQSYHYILSSLMCAVYAQTDKLMLKQMLDEETVGYYSLAATVSSMWVFVLAAVIHSVYPTILRLYQEDYGEYEKKNRQLYAVVFYASVFVSLMFLVFGGLIVKILYGEAYLPAVAPLHIVTWYTAFSYLGVARNAWIVCEHKQHYLKYMYFGAAVLNIVLNLCLIPILGTSGAALASLITQIFTSIALPYWIKDMRPSAKLMLQAILLQKLGKL